MKPVWIFLLACLGMGLAVAAILAFSNEYRVNHSPGSSCTIIYPGGSTAPGVIQPDGQCALSP